MRINHRTTISFYNRDGKIYAKLSVDGDYERFSTRILCPKDEWEGGNVAPKTKEGRVAYQKLQDLIDKLLGMEMMYYYNTEIVRKIMFDEYRDGSYAFTIMNALHYGLDMSIVRDSTKRSQQSAVDRFQEFLKEKVGYDDIVAEQINGSIAVRFTNQLLNDGCQPSYIAKVVGILSKFYEDFVDDHKKGLKYVPDNPFRSASRKLIPAKKKIPSKRRKTIREDSLSRDEIDLIINIKFSGPRRRYYEKWRRAVIWQIFTGFAFDDLCERNFKIKKTDEGEFIELFRGKTENRCVIPFLPEAKDLYEQYGKNLFPFKQTSDKSQKKRNYDNYRTFLKALSRMTKLPLRSHLFRHTFGMMMSRKHIPLEYIASMMGHTSTSTTEGFYVLPEDEVIVKTVFAKQDK